MAVASKTWTVAYGRHVRLRITAQEVEVDVPNNRSKVRVTGQIYYEGETSTRNDYPQTYTVTVDGTQIGRQTGITYNLASGGTRGLTTYTSGWLTHNSIGARTSTVRGHITDGVGDTATINQSYALTTIARASTLSSFSMPNHLKPSTTTSFSLGITRRSTSFTHDIQLRDGSTVIASWTGQSTPPTLSLTPTQTNTLLNRMSSSTSRTMTLSVQTKSGSTNIGGALTRIATVYVDSSVIPTVSGLSVAIEGNAHAKDNLKRFVQNISKVSGKVTTTANGGATIVSSMLQIRRTSGGADLQTIHTHSGTFPKVVALNGQYQAIGRATDSRGRSNNTGWIDLSNFVVLAYLVPQITRFSASRRTGTATTVDIVRNGTHSGLSGDNILGVSLQQRASGTTTWTNVVPNVNTGGNTFGATVPSTGHSVASSYDFKLFIADQFGNSAERITTVTTQRVVLNIHKNEGVGIGKIREKGVLDVDGQAHFRGDLFVNGIPTSTAGMLSQHNVVPSDTIAYWQDLPQGVYFIKQGELPNQPTPFGVMYHSRQGGDWNSVWYQQALGAVFRKSGNGSTMTEWIPIDRPATGSNENGSWMRFNDGTQICYAKREASSQITVAAGPIFRTNSTTWTYPQAFVGSRPMTQYQVTDRMGYTWAGLGASASTITSSTFAAFAPTQVNSVMLVDCLVIGRWK